MLLCTFGGRQFDENRRCLPLDTDHKPGGLWLTEDRQDGWKNHVIRCINNNPSEWCLGDLRYVTAFEFDPRRFGEDVWAIAGKEDILKFAELFGETPKRNCKDEDLASIRNQCITSCSGRCYNCYGVHINWGRVKAAYKGLALSFYSEEISYRSGNPSLHWSRLDCASWCFWDKACLTLVEANKETGYACDGDCQSAYCAMK